ncbi:MAG: cell division/cell wall cluster transcriptional repressor MraZ, partial [Mycoplasmataceae bacterium]|nr:cell division/cell wall cluster transcriptional repressor MraZ [Mycoplasmataceae bacterium]
MIGNYRNKLDIKGRLIIPIKFRDEFNGTVIVSLGLDQTLEIRNSEAFTAWT